MNAFLNVVAFETIDSEYFLEATLSEYFADEFRELKFSSPKLSE